LFYQYLVIKLDNLLVVFIKVDFCLSQLAFFEQQILPRSSKPKIVNKQQVKISYLVD